MKVYVVGSGCTWFERKNSSYILDDNMLLDMPEESYKKIIGLIDIFKLKTVFITHFHTDHFFGMHILITRIMREWKERKMKHRLKVYGPKGTLERLVMINKVVFGGDDECDPKALSEPIDFIDVQDGDEFEENGYKVKVFALDHGKVYSQGYIFEDKNGKVVAFTGDTKDCKRLHEMLDESNVAFVDMALVKPWNSHLDAKSFQKLEKEYPNCKMIAVHTSDESLEYAKKHGISATNDDDEYIF